MDNSLQNFIISKELTLADLNAKRNKLIEKLQTIKNNNSNNSNKSEDPHNIIFHKWCGEYKTSTFLGIKTNNYEIVNMHKTWVLLGDCISEFYTTKDIRGLDLVSGWNDGLNGTIFISTKDDIKIIKCVSQLMRGHHWTVTVFY